MTDRVLKEDEAHCLKCNLLFSSGDAFSEHEGPRGRCRAPEAIDLIERSGVWGFPGRDRTKKPRRTPAQAALDRLETRISGRSLDSVKKDLSRVRQVLERDRDR